MKAIDHFYEELRDQLAAQIEANEKELPDLCHWIFFREAQRFTSSRLDDETENLNPSGLLASLIRHGAEAAAFVTLRERIEATGEALIDQPTRDSDVRQAQVVYADSKLFVGPWRYTV